MANAINTKTVNVDELTRKATAFGSWDELCGRMIDNGYVPSLSSKKPAEARLARRLTESFLTVWNPATGKNWPIPAAE